ncbi:hypothetical protein IEQ34_002234 [Dendrobium chrysotoxum]|uniref:Uncharacterized protein n=1 Tax=Dendrobium chrysotoxum TaxID=161865 RepID=A0AAV7HJC3_DENCH|nr:hypothetical protein IEQ34_002234 [Dendrobium chrysotoxum]
MYSSSSDEGDSSNSCWRLDRFLFVNRLNCRIWLHSPELLSVVAGSLDFGSVTCTAMDFEAGRERKDGFGKFLERVFGFLRVMEW